MQRQSLDKELSAKAPSASESGANPHLPDSSIQGRNASRLLRAVAKKHNISSTKSLVAAYNAATDENERAVLLGWLRKYGEGSIDCLKPEVVLEYSELAKVAHVSEQDAKVLRKLVYGLGSLIQRDEFLDENVAKALLSALTWVDATAYGDPAQLIILARRLLLSLSSEPRLHRHNFAKYEANFLELHQVFFLLQSIGRDHVLEQEKRELRQAVTQKRDLMELSVVYYPVFFHFELIQQAVERLEIEDAPSRLTQVTRRAAAGIYGGMHVFHFLRKLAGGDIEPTSIEDAYRKGQAAIANAGVLEREWYDILQMLTEARLRALKEERKCELLTLAYDAAMEGQRKTTREDYQKALRFGIVQEMSLLASDRDSRQDARRKATTKLVELATNQAISEKWIHDADILTLILDALHMIHSMGEQKQEIAESLRKIQQSCDEHAKVTLTIWLDGNTVEEKLLMQRQEVRNEHHEDLFAKIRAIVGYLDLSIVRSKIEDLKKTYLHDNFATVPSLFEPEIRRHVKDMEHHIVVYEEIIEEMNIKRREERHRGGEGAEGESSTIPERDDSKECYEQKKKITTSISIEDLFKPRSLQAGVGESEIRGLLLYGNPGTGKTCIGKGIAHKWASGEILQEFEAVYMVPIRRLNVAKARGTRGEALEEVIAQMCFKQKGSDAEFQDLKTQVDDDLHTSSTLLIVDGLDEANEDARELISDAEKRSCKQLILTRPYNLRDMQARVDIEFECVGFNDDQLEKFIRKELHGDEALRLIHSLQQHQGMWETAHTPVTAHILCSLSEKHGTAIEDRGKRASVFRIYDDMATYVWKRFEEKPEARIANKNAVFGDLERIAFEALRSGQTEIEEKLVEACSTLNSRIMRQSGFLLRALEGCKYRFWHKTFQEFFAGKYIARSLKNKGSEEERRVLHFIQKGKYDQKNAMTLSFAMHAFGKEQKEFALKKMLSAVDEDPVEVLGIQHFFLKMRILEATLEEADEDELEDPPENEQAIELAEGARQLLERTIDDVLIREIVVEEFQNLSFVLQRFPRVLDAVIDDVKRILGCSDPLTWKTMAKTKDVLKLARHSPKQSHILIQFVLQLVEEPKGWCNPKECIRRLHSIAEQMPQHAAEILPTLAKWRIDEDWDVRFHAIEAIGRVVAAAPHLAGDLLRMLERGCDDEDSSVRGSAIEAVGRVAGSAPHLAGDLLRMLAKGCLDKHAIVVQYAIEAIEDIFRTVTSNVGSIMPISEREYRERDFRTSRDVMEVVEKVPEEPSKLVGDLLLLLVRGCQDDNSTVRHKAKEGVGRVVRSHLHLARYVQLILEKTDENKYSHVRKNVLEATARVIEAAPQHAGVVLSMLANGCVDEDLNVCRVAIKAIGRVVAAAPQHAGEVLSILKERCADEDLDVRRVAIKAIGRIVAAAPRHAGEVHSILTERCADGDSDVRECCIEAVGNIVSVAPHLAFGLRPMLEEGFKDKHSNVRCTAMEIFSKFIEAEPLLVVDLLPFFEAGFKDESLNTRRSAIKCIECFAKMVPHLANFAKMVPHLANFAEMVPQLANNLLEMLKTTFSDTSFDMRKDAVDAAVSIVKVEPSLENNITEIIEKEYEDESAKVRGKSIEAIGRIIMASPNLANKFRDALIKGCGDEDFDVRTIAIEALGNVFGAAPGLALDLLPTLEKVCCDEDAYVRRNAVLAIRNIVVSVPHIADDLLSNLKELCADGSSTVRCNAIETVETFAKAATHLVDELVPLLKKGYNDSTFRVRRSTMDAIGSVVISAPQIGGGLFPTLERGCGDVAFNVRCKAIKAIGSMGKAVPTLAEKLLPVLQLALEDPSPNIRQKSMEAFGSILAATPELTDKHLSILSRGCKEADPGVHQETMKVIRRIIKAAPSFAEGLREMVEEGCKDENSKVRREAVAVVKNIIDAAPSFAEGLREMVKERCKDEDFEVRQNAIEAIPIIAKAMPHLLEDFIAILERGCIDEVADVRQSAMEVIENMVSVAQHAAIITEGAPMGEYRERESTMHGSKSKPAWHVVSTLHRLLDDLLPTLAKGCGDKDSDVREKAIEAIGRVVAAAPQLAGDLLPTLANGCGDKDSGVREKAIEAVGGVVAAAPQLAGDLLPMLTRVCFDEDSGVREKAIEAIGRVVAAAPQLAGDLLPTLANGCGDKDSDVREKAIEAIGGVVAAAPQLAGDLLPTLANGCGDKDSDVREKAIEAIGRVVAAAPQLAGDLLPTLANGCRDKDSGVREKAIEAVGGVVAAAAQHAGVVLSVLANGCADGDLDVRRVAIKAIGRVVAAAPQLAGDLLPTLANGCRDKDSGVREKAIEAVGGVVAAAAQHAGVVLSMLANGCADGDLDVRPVAIKAIGRVVAAAPQLAGDLLPILARMCGDEAAIIRNGAKKVLKRINPLEAVSTSMESPSTSKEVLVFFFVQNSFTLGRATESKTLPIILHTISSQEVGIWSKNDIDLFVGCVRREFDEKFPGLLGHLEANK